MQDDSCVCRCVFTGTVRAKMCMRESVPALPNEVSVCVLLKEGRKEITRIHSHKHPYSYRSNQPQALASVRICVIFVWFTSSLLASAFAPAPALTQVQQPARAAASRRHVCMSARKRAAVVGAGAAGLAAAKQLRQDGHAVRVFEMSDDVGGVWHYDEKVEEDPMGNPVDARVHSSMYASLRTNLPREVMAYDALPFTEEFDERRFPHHSAVHKYLSKFADIFELRPLISFGRKVTKLERLHDHRASTDAACDGPAQENGFQGVAWAVEHAAAGGGGELEREEFDVVLVCNGHYTEPVT